MNLLCCALAIVPLTFIAASTGRAQVTHDVTATSSVHVEIGKNKDGESVVVMVARNARFIPYVLYENDKHLPRLATVTTDVRTRTDAEGVDPASTIAVTVDDLSAKEPKRLAAFSDPGADGVVLGSRYFASTMPGCCDSPEVHRVRALETGVALFRSTGPGSAGSAAWAQAPNSHPDLVRWAAFNGEISEEKSKKGYLGTITYGGADGALSILEVRTKPGASNFDDLWEGLAHGAVLVWIDSKAPKDSGAPSSGEPDSPQQIWAVNNVSDPKQLGGFSLALVLDHKRLALIPIVGDRLVAGRATVARDFIVAAPSH
jgi:hypothetical protein